MQKRYAVQNTTKIQREKFTANALALSLLGALEPSKETMSLVQEYIDGKREIFEIRKMTVERYIKTVK